MVSGGSRERRGWVCGVWWVRVAVAACARASMRIATRIARSDEGRSLAAFHGILGTNSIVSIEQIIISTINHVVGSSPARQCESAPCPT